MERAVVSIFMLTYNQEKFIAQAIEGVMMQETNYHFELVIGEDASTDKTFEICESYAKRFPERIRLFQNESNLGLINNYLKTFNNCRGKYIAICDGDDYWIDRFKLQKQVDFLENNRTFKLIYSNVYYLYPSGKRLLRNQNSLGQFRNFEDLVFDNQIPSVTALFVNEELPPKMISWMRNLPYGDWPTYLYILRNGGEIKYLTEPTAVYRKIIGTSNSLRAKKSRIGEINLSILKNIIEDNHFARQKKLIQNAITRYEIGLMGSYNKERNFRRSLGVLACLLFKTNPFYVVKVFLYTFKRTFDTPT